MYVCMYVCMCLVDYVSPDSDLTYLKRFILPTKANVDQGVRPTKKPFLTATQIQRKSYDLSRMTEWLNTASKR